jgi:hypothetical protein
MVDAMEGVGGGGIPDISPQNKKRMYEAEYKHAANLFDRSLDGFAHSDNKYKKEAFQKVMDQSMQVLKDVASELKRQELLQQCKQIEQDYNEYKSKGTADAEIKLHDDLEKAGKRLKN